MEHSAYLKRREKMEWTEPNRTGIKTERNKKCNDQSRLNKIMMRDDDNVDGMLQGVGI